MNSARSDQPDYGIWADGLKVVSDLELLSDETPSDRPGPEPPEDKPAFSLWEGLSTFVEIGTDPVGEVGREIRLMTPGQLAIVALFYLGATAPGHEEATFPGWLTVVIILAVLGGLALFWSERNGSNRESGADPPADAGDDPAGE